MSCERRPPVPAKRTEPEVIADAKKLVVLAVPEIVRAVVEALVAVKIEPLNVRSESSVKTPAVVM